MTTSSPNITVDQVLDAHGQQIGNVQGNVYISIHYGEAATPSPNQSLPYVFLSYSHADRNLAEQLTLDLLKAGVNLWRDRMDLKPGTANWEQGIREAIRGCYAVAFIATPNSLNSHYALSELQIARLYDRTIIPLWAAGDHWEESAPLALIMTQHIDGRGEQYAAAVDQLIGLLQTTQQAAAAIQEQGVALPTPDFVPRNPYKGLAAFTERDQSDFFGRDELIDTLLEALQAQTDDARLLTVIGPSGSGKSSVVMAGLLPRLRDGAVDGSAEWVYLEPVLPGAHPLENLRTVLANALPERSQRSINEDLDSADRRGLLLLARQIAGRHSAERLVLFIDQFEEVFTQTVDEDERKLFIDLLVAAVIEPRGALLAILTMRADFYDRPLAYGQLGALIETHHKVILPMTLDDLRDVIEKPATLPDVLLTFEDGLVGDLLFEVRDQAGGLPLLQFALEQLFHKRDGQRLTLGAYREIGGVRGALARHAEQTYQGLKSDPHRELARTLFLRLIEPGETEQDTTRRRASLTELNLPDPEQTRLLHEVAVEFTDARLLTTSQVAERPTIEVSHEALIREWDQLRRWLRDARQDLIIQRNVADDAAAWIARGQQRDDDGLYRGRVLAENVDWAQRNRPSADEMALIEASVAREQHLAAAAARQRQRFRLMGAGLLATVIVALLAVVLIQRQQNEGLEAEVSAWQWYQGRVSTLAAGGAHLAFQGTLVPAEVFADATAVAVLHAWTPTARTDDLDVAMVQVPAGCFWMGSNAGDSDEKPAHEVCLENDFWIDRYEVTNAEYQRFVEDGGYENVNYWTVAGWGWKGERTDRVSYREEFNEPQQPVISVTWYEAQAYCTWRGARLPTEAEWEFAARGPDSLVYPWGNAFEADYVIYGDNSVGRPAGVGPEERPAGQSWVGAYDLSGNVWEWVADWYGLYPQDGGRQVNPGGAEESEYLARVLRGGAWPHSDPNDLRTAERTWDPADFAGGQIGFRCARPLNNEERQQLGLAMLPPSPTPSITPTPSMTPSPTITMMPTATAVPLPVRFGETVTGAVNEGESDAWIFEGEAGQIVTITMNETDGQLDAILVLLGPDREMLISDDDSGDNLNAAITLFELPATGTYTIMARGYAAGEYALTLTQPVILTSAGGEIGFGVTVFGDVIERERDTWTFEGQAGQIVIITMNVTNGEMAAYLQLLGPDGELLQSRVGYPNAEIAWYELPASGTYTIIARDLSWMPGGYALTLIDASAATATPGLPTATPAP